MLIFARSSMQMTAVNENFDLVIGNTPFQLNENAHRQLGLQLKIPAPYYERMRAENPGLLMANVNGWFQQSPDTRRMVRTLDGTARAILSDRYRRIDNYEVAQTVLPIISEMQGARIESCELTDTRMYIKVVNERIQTEVVPGDIVQAGILISNSEVGMGSVSVKPLIYRLVCTNGMVADVGVGKRHVGRMLIPYDAEKIQRECKWFPLSTVRLALTVYKQIGLIFENPDGTLSISDYQNMIGSETDWAAKNRRIRSNAANKELQEGHDTGHTSGHNVSSDGGENVPTEKEIEKDKEIENRERVRDNGSTAVDAGLSEIIRSFEDNIGSFPPAASDALMGWREIFTDDLILLAIKKAALAGIRKWNYVNGILKVWKNEGVRTLGDVQSRDERRKPPAGQQPKRSAAEDYNEIFGELLGGST